MKYINLAAAVLFISLSLYAWFAWNEIKQLRNQKESVTDFLHSQKDTVTHYRNKYNEEVAKAKVMRMDISTIRDLRKEESLQFLSEFEGLKRNLKNLEAAVKLSSRLTTTVATTTYDTTIIRYDSAIKSKAFHWKNQYTRADGLLVNDSIHMIFVSEVPISGVLYWERRWFLGKKRYSTEFSSKNRDIRITNVEVVQVKKKKGRLR